MSTLRTINVTHPTSATNNITLDSSGNVGIGTASPVNGLTLGSGKNLTYLSTSYSSWTTKNYQGTYYFNNGVDRVFIDANGNLVIDNTVATNSPTQGVSIGPNGGIGSIGIGHVSGTASGNTYLNFCYNGTGIGNIAQSGTTNIAVNGTSDYRLKNNLRQADGIDLLSQIQVHKFDWVDGREDNGFIAHELQTVLPGLVVGEKDAVNENGAPVYQMVNYIGIIPLLTKAIQELSVKNDALEARLAALESK
jgi:hypothetical protein